eukprot:1983227-Amphidinium_carterae.1
MACVVWEVLVSQLCPCRAPKVSMLEGANRTTVHTTMRIQEHPASRETLTGGVKAPSYAFHGE